MHSIGEYNGDMTNVRATWAPYWYELDTPIAVGDHGEFAFDAGPASAGKLVFSNGPWEPERSIKRAATIISITHPTLGAINRVETKGLTYRVVLSDETEFLVEAEERELGAIISVSDKRRAHLESTVPDWSLEVVLQLDGARLCE